MSLKEDLKEMIVRECDKDNDIIFDPNHPLGLDSLQISMAIQNEYGIRLADPKEARRVMESINTLADYIESNTYI